MQLLIFFLFIYLCIHHSISAFFLLRVLTLMLLHVSKIILISKRKLCHDNLCVCLTEWQEKRQGHLSEGHPSQADPSNILDGGAEQTPPARGSGPHET